MYHFCHCSGYAGGQCLPQEPRQDERSLHLHEAEGPLQAMQRRDSDRRSGLPHRRSSAEGRLQRMPTMGVSENCKLLHNPEHEKLRMTTTTTLPQA